ncbi:ROK family glucokinase [Thalassobacillus sp. CUG 92003]|uniref:ROK family glucokinase n=1 Tax=Thalassobacillus sp. CUG 92003 TaxID=2736641 RepID=UPI0015E75957|nr:ROK family glucokinase [Thalassobacillus sp. CUG 92003]
MKTQMYVVGVDIGGTSIKAAILSEEGVINHKWEIPTNQAEQGTHIALEVYRTIDETLANSGLSWSQIKGVGVGAPAFVDTDTGYVYESVNIGWKHYHLGEELRGLAKVPVFIDNDANLAALGENWLGAGKQTRNLLAITLGTGVGGGAIVNGELLSGANGTAAEVGHMTMVTEGGAPCNCGKNGCLETEASARAISRKANEAADAHPDSLLNEMRAHNGDITAKDVFDIAEQGDLHSERVIQEVTDTLGLAIANMAVLTNPAIIVIGGGVSKAGDQLLSPLRKAFDTYALPRTSEACEFRIAQLGNDAGVIGGAYLVKERS